MNRCNACGIVIMDEGRSCPFCKTALVNCPDEFERVNFYPDILKKTKLMTKVLRMILTAFVSAGIICVFINYKLGFKPAWSLVVVGSLAFIYRGLLLYLKGRVSFFKKIFVTVLYSVGLTILIDAVFGFYRWSINYVIPGAQFFMCLLLIIFMIINRRKWESYIVWQLTLIVTGAIPLILSYFFDLMTRPLVTQMAFIATVIIFVGTLIMGGRRAREELRRRFHIL